MQFSNFVLNNDKIVLNTSNGRLSERNWSVKLRLQTRQDVSRVMRKPVFACTKTNAQTVNLISAFVFATQIVLPLYFLNQELQDSSHILWLYSPVFVDT